MRISAYNNGVSFEMARPDRTRVGGGKRGKLDGSFSASSFRRLREFCVTHDVPLRCWGVTLTIPGLHIVNQLYVKEYIHLLSQWGNYHCLPFVWRCELQRRGQAHLHCVIYSDDVRNVLLFMWQWHCHISKTGKCVSAELVSPNVKDFVWINRMFVNGSIHAFDLQELKGDFRSWRYLVSHTSKRKLEQQGWRGRQWGVVRRASFETCLVDEYDLTDSQIWSVRRWVQRLTRMRIHSVGKHFRLVNPNSVRMMVNYSDELFQCGLNFTQKRGIGYKGRKRLRESANNLNLVMR